MNQPSTNTPQLAPLTADCLSALPGLRHGFFTTAGGVSTGIYKSLNCGLGSKDDQQAVLQNRRRVADFLAADDVITLYQIHSAMALVVDTPWPDGIAPPQADALVTKKRGLAIGALTADCAPVLFADSQAGIVAAAHAGWRGAASGILEATIATMVKLGAERTNICAALGPCISQEAYEVGPEFEAKMLELHADNIQFFSLPDGAERVHFDLPAYVLHRLQGSGIGAIEQQALCTYRHPDRLYSYRRSQHNNEPDYGRQISAIVLI